MRDQSTLESPHSVDACVERLCRIGARRAYRVAQRRRVTHLRLSDLDLDREPSGSYAIACRAQGSDLTWRAAGGSAFLSVEGRLVSTEAGTEMALTVGRGRPPTRRDRTIRSLWDLGLAIGLLACVVGAALTGSLGLWTLTGAYVVVLALLGVLSVLVRSQATRAVVALLARTVSAPVAAEEDVEVTLSST